MKWKRVFTVVNRNVNSKMKCQKLPDSPKHGISLKINQKIPRELWDEFKRNSIGITVAPGDHDDKSCEKKHKH